MNSLEKARFWEKVKKTPTCWLWTASVKPEGYGQFAINRKPQYAHRIAWTLLRGRIPGRMTLDHVKERCRNRNCVNPNHLEVVTNKENVLRGRGIAARNARKVRCVRGHRFSGSNLYIRPNGHRRCRTCARIQMAAWRSLYLLGLNGGNNGNGSDPGTNRNGD